MAEEKKEKPEEQGKYEGMDEKAFFKKIQGDFRESFSAMGELHKEFREYDDYYHAKQWNENRASWRPNPVINYVSYIVDQKTPQLTNARPTGLILPTTANDDEVAKLFTQVTDVIADKVDLDGTVEEVVRSGLLFGTGWFYVYWDNGKSGGSYDKRNLWKGDVCVEVVDPSNIYIDPSATTIEEARYVIYAVPKTTQWIKEMFRVDLNAEASFETDIYDRPSNNHGKDRVMFYAYWWRENGGLHCAYAAGGKILKELKNLYRHGRFPFIPFTPKKGRKSVWGIGEPKNIINNQKLLNKFVEMPATNALMTANPIALIDGQSGIDEKKWVNKPGQSWKVRDVDKAVKWLTPPNISSDVYKVTADLVTYIEKIGGVYDAATGNTPSGVTAATAIQLLQDQASIPVKGIASNLYRALKEVYEQMIELIKEFYTEERVIRITDEEKGGFQFLNFRGSDYAEIDLDVKVSAGSSTPTSRAYLAQISSELLDRQIILPSEYMEMQENIPNKDRIVARLREQEAAPPPQPQQGPPEQMPPPEMAGMPPEAAMMPPGGMPMGEPQQAPPISLQEIYEKAPDELKQQIDLMAQQGMPEQEIINAIFQMIQGGQ
ncbi:phage portal protein [Brevibacillus centrosporus]|uniref:portal protein n=1 Tax=Brevibacillus centrosporus TaxID=54910 RepID=UPI002E1D7B55|nr:phage portal protein [Brevibacillus centrosporus]